MNYFNLLCTTRYVLKFIINLTEIWTINSTVEPLYNGHSFDRLIYPLKSESEYIVFSLYIDTSGSGHFKIVR